MSIGRIRIAVVGVVAAIAMFGTGLTMAHASGSTLAKGKLIQDTWSYSYATKASWKMFPFKKGTPIFISCKLNSVPVDGNPRWYNLGDDYNGNNWVPARYVRNIGPAPKACDVKEKLAFGKVIAKPSLIKRTKPTTKSAAKGTIKHGTKIGILCKIAGQKVGGNKLWYQLTDGRWVTARYVDNIGKVPGYCDRLS